jgi:hypothetical protein
MKVEKQFLEVAVVVHGDGIAQAVRGMCSWYKDEDGSEQGEGQSLHSVLRQMNQAVRLRVPRRDRQLSDLASEQALMM